MKFKVSKAKEYAILYLRDTKNSEEIAEELQLAVATVEEVLADNPVEVVNDLPSDKDRSFHRPVNGVAMLTKEGAQIAETITASPPKRPEAIFRPNG